MGFKQARNFQRFLRMALVGPAKSGKAQPLDAKILTPTGWKLMGEIQAGDEVINSQGTISHVTGVFPQGEKEIYRVTMTDGTFTECCDDHLWFTRTLLDRDTRQPRLGTVKTLREIRDTLTYQGRNNHALPMVKPIEFAPGQGLTLDPYLFGVLLGDGCFRERFVTLSNPDKEIQESVRELLPVGVELQPLHKVGVDFALRRTASSGNNIIVDELRSDQLAGKKSTEKFIPDRYKFVSVKQRIALLQGLLDTDGCAHGYTVEYSSSSQQLAEDVQFLVESLGGKAHIASRVPRYTHNGEYREGAVSYRLHIRVPRDIAPFRVPRKLACYKPRGDSHPHTMRSIQGIEFVGMKQAQCITVDAPDHLYVTDHCILTHNSFTALTIAHALAEHGKVAVIDTENASASKYAEQFPPFDVCELESFHPDGYVAAIREAEKLGYDVVIVDSLTHAWNGPGGLLEMKQQIAISKERGMNDYTAWGRVTPKQNKLIYAITHCKMHIICTMRTKMEYEAKTEDGHLKITRLGLAPIQRDETEYEFDILGAMDHDHTMTIEGSRCPDLDHIEIKRPDGTVAETIKRWLAGEPLPEPTEQQLAIAFHLRELYDLAPRLYTRYHNWQEMVLRKAFGVEDGALPTDYTDEHVELMRAYVEAKRQEKEVRAPRGRSSTPSSPVKQDEAPPKSITPPVTIDRTEQTSLQLPPDLDSLIKQAKLRAQKLGLAKDAAEWANLLKTCEVTVVKSTADLAKVIEYMDAFEREQETPDAAEMPVMATEQQMVTLKKLYGYLGRSIPDLDGLTEQNAGQMIIELSAAYKEARAALPVR